jgi:putative transcriptional regulator
MRLTAAALLLPAVLVLAQPSPQLDLLAPGMFLVAAKQLGDPNFSQTVVLLVEHGPSGAMGLVVNRPSEVRVARIFPTLPEKAGAASLFVGGPVNRAGAMALRRSKTKPADRVAIVDDIYLVTDKDELERNLRSAGTETVRVFLGYSGWAAGQLEREISLGAWHVLPATAAQVFDDDMTTLWRRLIGRANSRIAMRRQGAASVSLLSYAHWLRQ